jgi:hypothetical protein
MTLTEQIDSLESLEAIVLATESGLAKLESEFDTTDMDNFRSQVTAASLSLEALQRSNSARQRVLAFRKIYVLNHLPSLASEPNLTIPYERQPSVKLIDPSDFSDLESLIAPDTYNRIKARQARLNQFEIDLRIAEEQSAAKFNKQIESARIQARTMASIREHCHERTKTEFDLTQVKERIARLQLALWQLMEAETPERRAVAVNTNLRHRVESHQREIAEAEEQIQDLKGDARRRNRLYAQQRKALANGLAQVLKTEQENQKREEEIERLEERAADLQFELNLKLKAAHRDSGYQVPAEAFVDRPGLSQRIGELLDVVGLVAVEREA